MKAHPGFLPALLGLMLTTSLLVALTAGSAVTPGAVYAVAQVQAGLADHAQQWVGRTVRVRGMADPCPGWEHYTARRWQCADEPLMLVPAPGDQAADSLPLRESAPDAFLAVLPALPFLSDLVARPQTVPVFTPARFQVRVDRLAAQACDGRSPCYVAVLLAVTPATP